MNHHRLGLTALILLLSLTGGLIFGQWYQSKYPRIEEVSIPFDEKIPEVIRHVDLNKKQVAFTFDGGEGNQSAETILNILRKHQVRGTFFLTGKWVLRNPELVKRMHNEGHEIYNHTFNHPKLPFLTDQEILKQLVLADSVISSLTGTSTKPYFRPPYGEYDEHVLTIAASLGYRAVMWTIDAGDWMESDGYTAIEVKDRIMNNLAPGAIILMHIGDTITGSVLDEVLTEIKALGYKIVPLSI